MNWSIFWAVAFVGLGSIVTLFALSFPTTTCLSGTGIERTCTTDMRAVLTVIIIGIFGLLLGGIGIHKLYTISLDNGNP